MKTFIMFFICIISLLTGGCTVVSPDGDHVGVVMIKPWFFGHGGVDTQVVESGLSYVALSSEDIYFRKTPRNIKENFTDMNTSDNFPVDFDAYVNLKIREKDAWMLYKDFGRDDSAYSDIDVPQWYIQNLSTEIREIIRDELSKMSMMILSTRGVGFSDAQTKVSTKIKQLIRDKKIPVDLLGLSFSKVNPDELVMDERARTAAQEQRKATETNKAAAEVERKNAETKRAEADSAYATKMELSPEQFTRIEQTKICANSEKCTLILGDAKPVINTAK